MPVGCALLFFLHPGRSQTAQIQVYLLQDFRIFPKAVDKAVVVLYNRGRHGKVFRVESTFVGKKEADADLLLAHEDPLIRLISGKEKRKASTARMAELTHHWHQAWMT